jgi:ankyrin repeat protein
VPTRRRWYDDGALDLSKATPESAAFRLGDRVLIADTGEPGVAVALALPPAGGLRPLRVQVRMHDGTMAWHEAAELDHCYCDDEFQPSSPLPEAMFDADRAADCGVHLAAAGGHVGVLRALLAAGASPHAWNAAGRTPLHVAAGAGSTGCVEALLEAGADVDAPMALGICDTAVHAAAAGGHAAALRALVDAGACFEGKNGAGKTPRDVACSNAVRRVLNEAAAKAKAAADAAAAAAAALFTAAAADDAPALRAEMEVKGADTLVGMRDSEQRTLLHVACAAGAAAAAAVLLAAGADVAAKNAHGASPLHGAVSLPDADAALALAAVLLAAGAPIDAADADGATPLHGALTVPTRCAEALVRALLAAGAETSARTIKRGETAAHVAARCGQARALDALLSRGGEPGALDAAGATALHAAAGSTAPGAPACLDALLAAGASSLARTAAGKTPADVAHDADVKAKLAAIAAAAARVDPAARWEAEKGRPDFMPVPALDEIMRMTGLKSVKAQVLGLYSTVRVVAARNAVNKTAAGVLQDTCLHMRFDGCVHFVCFPSVCSASFVHPLMLPAALLLVLGTRARARPLLLATSAQRCGSWACCTATRSWSAAAPRCCRTALLNSRSCSKTSGCSKRAASSSSMKHHS